jgi:hypothetical protein
LEIGLESGDSGGEPPDMAFAGQTEWNGSRVTFWRGRPDPKNYPPGFPTPAWVVSADWTSRGHGYSLAVIASPEFGHTGTLRGGMKLVRQYLANGIRYAAPS